MAGGGYVSQPLLAGCRLLRELRCACMWGPHLGNLVVERGILSHGQVTITGCPRFDFYHPTWRPVWNGTAELGGGLDGCGSPRSRSDVAPAFRDAIEPECWRRRRTIDARVEEP